MDTPPHDLEPHELDLYKRFKVLRRELQSVVVDLASAVLHRIDVLQDDERLTPPDPVEILTTNLSCVINLVAQWTTRRAPPKGDDNE